LQGGDLPQQSIGERGDAQLADVWFADGANGWAVGDRGVIWHTADAGEHWNLQASGVDCRLASVCFIDEQTGWAAGGSTQPYTRSASGVVLHTRDGGSTWTLNRKLVLPTVSRIRFFDAQHGWAIGRSSALFPSGVFSTQDGGRSWSPISATESGAWLTGDFIDPNTGAMAGPVGRTAALRRRGIESANAAFGLRALADMKLVAPNKGWLVGEGGLALRTQDLGKSWQTSEGEIPPALRNQFDFQALAVRGEHVWAAGTPGTRVLHSADAGRTWNVADTGQSVPIRAITFSDDGNGCAVGDLGTILTTADGGKTWTRRRAGGSRAAYAAFVSRATDLPWELVARLSAEEGYLGAIEVLNREDLETRDAADGAIAQEATVLAGGSIAGAAWRFPLRQAGLKLGADELIDIWNSANDGQAIDKLEAHIVGRIRMWRPNIVVTSAADVRGGDPAAHIVNQVVLRAVEHAADPAHFPEQLAEAGLRPWSVQKVFAALPAGQAGAINVNTAQLSNRLGRSIGELAAPARGVLAPEFSPPPAVVGFRLLVDRLPQQIGQRDFFSGIPLSPGCDARRPLDELVPTNLEATKREVQMRRNLQAILARNESDERDGRFLADFGEQTRRMEPVRAAEVLFQLGERYYRLGRWPAAAECFELVVGRYPTSPLAGKSLVWLVQYYSSSEAAWRNRAPQQHRVEQVSAHEPVLPSRAGSANDKAAPEGMRAMGRGARRQAAIGAGAEVATATGLVLGDAEAAERLAKAAGYAKQLEELQPALYSEPFVRFPLAVAQRQQGSTRVAERFYAMLKSTRPNDAWRDCAAAELWLADRKSEGPKSVYTCRIAPGKPRLDARLDEPFWRTTEKAQLHSALRDDADWEALAMLAYDEEFLYIAVSCTRAERFKYEHPDEPRPRDAELADQDRVELMIDVDRDFATYYQLAIDCRGWTGERCWQDSSWNPNWFVAAGQTDTTWTAEAAIPLSELGGSRSGGKRAWALGIQRIVPGVGFQSWTVPASPSCLPEGFGYLLFE
jgi:photosystem II stability/assembly factor-like uncharacterized protein